ncbi:MAG: transcription termination factor NusA [Candidatus Omnitrophota bacterium]
MNSELLSILDSLEREKGINREILFEAIEAALSSAAKKILSINRDDIIVKVDRESGSITVTSDGKIVKSDEFGRIAAQTAKQVIIQKIREAERDVIFDDYSRKQGGITSGLVHRFEKGNIIVDLGKAEAILPRSEQVQKEKYRQGDRVRAYILEVRKTSQGPQVVLSRRAPEFVKKLFELEVPEILEGIVEIRGIAREPGERTKIAVFSKESKVDPVGACVGMRGTRVKDIVRELHGERIDVIRWDDTVDKFLANALAPVDIKKMILNREKNHIQVIVADDQLSIGIGKHGQNIRLASQLIGWEVDIRGETKAPDKSKGKDKGPAAEGVEAKEEAAKSEVPESEVPESPGITDIKGVGKAAGKVLLEAGYDTVAKIAEASPEDLIKLEGIGKKGAEKIITAAKEMTSGPEGGKGDDGVESKE